MRIVDESERGFGWISPEPRFMQRTSHALVAGGKVWLIDPVLEDGALERIRALGEPAGVLQLLDRHGRDCADRAELGLWTGHLERRKRQLDRHCIGQEHAKKTLSRCCAAGAGTRWRSGFRSTPRWSVRTRLAPRSTTARRPNGSPSIPCSA